MNNFEKIKKEIIDQLNKIKYIGDLSDIGNEIGVVIGNYISDDETVDDFIHGIKHGISLTNGTHDQPDKKEDIYKKSLGLLDKFLNSGDADTFFEKMAKKIEIQQNRFNRFEEWLKYNDFDLLISRLISEHDEKYRKKCYDKGFEIHPNNKLGFLINYVTKNAKSVKVKKIDSPFSNEIWFFKGYYFQMIWGQGTITYIYDKNKKTLLQV